MGDDPGKSNVRKHAFQWYSIDLGPRTFWNKRKLDSCGKGIVPTSRMYGIRGGESESWGQFDGTSMTYPEMADDLVGFIDWVRKITGEKQVNLHGHSMGGKTVAQLATTPEYAPKIKNLIVEDMSPLGYPLKRAEYLDCIKHMIATDMNKTRDEVLAELGEKVSKVLLYQFVRGNLGEDVNGKAQWTCNLNVIDETYIYLLSHDIRFGVFDGPTLFQRASGSGFLPAAHKNRVKKMFPMVKFAETAWSNHWIHADDPKFFVDSICDFLEEPKELGGLGQTLGI
ncbi:Protein CBG15380 [Caenorhabditis briggsae]|uniref:Protein CBG15380 n=1 Tax=Caenorhabditis briggsae TaxID=6238 RepID=A8XM24_CAEBR|nr:Protein CBG15380 [Caenorhabditis briggsae]CAP33699.2 Protein CBG15380 [Caenorhabditis briggsae]